MRSAPLAVLLAACAGAGVIAGVVTDREPSASGLPLLNPPAAPADVLLYDGFDGSHLDRTRWNTCYWWGNGGCTIATNHELQWYVPRRVHVRDGTLRLVAGRDSLHGAGRGYRFSSGMISSGPAPGARLPRFAFRYGRAEIRAKVPHGRGLWPAFWLLPADRQSRPEIDVMEIKGQQPGTVQMHLHYRNADGRAVDRGTSWTDRGLRSGWHTFAVDWQPGRLIWLVDGVARWQVTGEAVPDQRMYLLANLAVGGDFVGPPGRSTIFPSAFRIDYVKVSR